MKHKIGTLCMILGAALILGALSLFLCNRYEVRQAQISATALMPLLKEQIEATSPDAPTLPTEAPAEVLQPEDLTMTEVWIDGLPYIGYLSIPKLELELPVLSDWDYDKLQIAPCRYNGTVRGEDLVLMAHNYDSHFGTISRLSTGDSVIFTDMDGIATVYTVAAQDVLAPTAVEEMTAGDFDLCLFTCTYGGQSRITVCCNRA